MESVLVLRIGESNKYPFEVNLVWATVYERAIIV
jgi:hypothetical protein